MAAGAVMALLTRQPWSLMTEIAESIFQPPPPPDTYLRLDRVEPTIDQLARLIQRFCVEPQTASPH